MHDHEPCEVDGCPALVASDRGLCTIHVNARRIGRVTGSPHCPNCQRAIEPGDWVTQTSTLERVVHAVCPAKRVYAGRKKDRVKPLLDAIEGI